MIGGVFAGVLWELAKYVFSYYVRTFADYNKVYGSLAGIILILVWIYVSAICNHPWNRSGLRYMPADAIVGKRRFHRNCK